MNKKIITLGIVSTLILLGTEVLCYKKHKKMKSETNDSEFESHMESYETEHHE